MHLIKNGVVFKKSKLNLVIGKLLTICYVVKLKPVQNFVRDTKKFFLKNFCLIEKFKLVKTKC